MDMEPIDRETLKSLVNPVDSVEANIWFEEGTDAFGDVNVQSRHMASLLASMHTTLNDIDPATVESIILLTTFNHNDNVFASMGGEIGCLPDVFMQAMIQAAIARGEETVVPEDLQL